MKHNEATRSFLPNGVNKYFKNCKQKNFLLTSRILRSKITDSAVPTMGGGGGGGGGGGRPPPPKAMLDPPLDGVLSIHVGNGINSYHLVPYRIKPSNRTSFPIE